MTPDQFECLAQSVAEKAVEVAVPRALKLFGIDADNPMKVQADMAYLRSLRIASDRVRTGGIIACIGALATGFGAVLWYAITHAK